MKLEEKICSAIARALQELFGAETSAAQVKLQPTRKDFEGSLTFVTFPYLKQSRKPPEATGQLVGEYLQQQLPEVSDFNVVKGFLNLVVADSNRVQQLLEIKNQPDFGRHPANGQKVMVEYSSPNTNKPLHLGHLRNNFLGFSVSEIMAAAGYQVMKVNLVNDRGIHICKSMLAYQQFGQGETPSDQEKGDKLVGRYYVLFDAKMREQAAPLLEKFYQGQHDWVAPAQQEKAASLLKQFQQIEAELDKLQQSSQAKGSELKTWQKKLGSLQDDIKKLVQNHTALMEQARQMLQQWEKGEGQTVNLWKKMNGWVYQGFDQTYKTIGVNFDKIYYESETYLLGKDIVAEGLQKGVFFKKADGSVWVDLTPDGLDEKIVLRGDGTAVYITQDMGTADLKHSDFAMNKSVYVVGNEQDYHFMVLKLIMQKIGRDYANGIYHLSYGMVDLPSGKMKSREGTVVDADDLVADMADTARERTEKLGKIEGFTSEEAGTLYKKLALGALKYYLLRVDPKKRMLFNPEESIDFQGNTGVYIQYNFAKINAIIRKAQQDGINFTGTDYSGLEQLADTETAVIEQLAEYPGKVTEAAENYAPSIICNYAYDLSKTYSRFYADLPIFAEPDPVRVAFRVLLSAETARVLEKAMNLLGVEMPERM